MTTTAHSPASRSIDPLLLITSILLLATTLTWIIPAGRYQRHRDPATGQNLVVAGSFQPVPAQPVTPWGMALAIPQGLIEAASVVFYCFLAGGALTVVEKTGAIGNTLDHLVARFGGQPELILILVSAIFLAGGASYGMYEEILAFLPLLCALMVRLGLNGEMAVALSLGTASIAGAFSPFNTFLLGISQPMAELRLFSAFGFRLVFFVLAIAIWIAFLLRHARRTWARNGKPVHMPDAQPAPWSRRDLAVLAILSAGMAVLVAGAIAFAWELPQFAAVFVCIALAAGLTGRLGLRGTSETMAEGFRRLAYASLLIGFARAISVVLNNGLILDTLANALFAPLKYASVSAAGILMLLCEYALAFPMPSDSGRAMMSLPVILPLADLLGLSRQIAVTAFQCSSTISGLVVPTAGSLLAMLAMAQVPYGRWLRFIALPIALLMILAAAAIAVGVALGVR